MSTMSTILVSITPKFPLLSAYSCKIKHGYTTRDSHPASPKACLQLSRL